MKRIIQGKNFLRKIAIAILVVLLCYCIVPTYTYAGFGGEILKVFTQLLAALGDVVTGTLNHFMLGTDEMINSVMLDRDNPTVTNPEGALYADPNAEADLILGQDQDVAGNTDDDNEEEIYGGLWGDDDEWEVPNILYSPEAIFSNNVAALDVNFLSPNTYSAVQDGGSGSAQIASQSSAEFLQSTISNWYVGFRNISAVALLVVLVYIGIKILIGSIAEKAKHKEMLRDWFVALCLVFIIHFIMSGILMITQRVTSLFEGASSGIVVEVRENRSTYNSGTDSKFTESLIGVARLRVQSKNAGVSAAFCAIYLVLVVYTIMFTFTYFKRFLYMAFLTMIAPLVAISYPIDRAGDGHAQAFNLWFKGYIMNAIIQPLHLILYTALVSSANDLVVKNPIYAIVAIAFLIPAEKFVKKLFGFDKAETPGSLGGFAAGAVTMGAMQKLSTARNLIGGGKNQNTKPDKVRTADNNGGNNYLSSNPRYSGIGSVSGNLRGPGNSGSSDSGDNGGDNPQGGSGGAYNTLGSGDSQEGANQPGDSSLGVRMASNGEENGNQVDPGQNGGGMTVGLTGTGDSGANNGIDNGISEANSGVNGSQYEIKDPLGERAKDWAKERASDLGNWSVGKAKDLGNSFANTKVGGGIVAAGTWAGNTTVGKGAKAVGRGAKRLASNKYTKAAGKMAFKGAKTLGKGVWKNKGRIAKTLASGAMSIGGAALGVGIGAAAGLASGDPSKVFSYAGTGLVSGGMIGKNAVDFVAGAGGGAMNLASRAAEKGRNIRYDWNEALDGVAVAERKEQAREDRKNKKKFMKDEEEIKKAKRLQAQLEEQGQKVKLDDIMKSRYDYVAAGVKDSEIEKAQLAEAKNGINGDTHGNYVSLAREADKLGISKATFSDDKKYNEFLNTLSTDLGGEAQGREAMGMIANIKGASNVHEAQLRKRDAARQAQQRQQSEQNEQANRVREQQRLQNSAEHMTDRERELQQRAIQESSGKRQTQSGIVLAESSDTIRAQRRQNGGGATNTPGSQQVVTTAGANPRQVITSGRTPSGNAPSSNKPSGGTPSGNAPSSDKPSGGRPSGKASSSDKPSRGRPSGNTSKLTPPSGTTPGGIRFNNPKI